MKNFGKNPLKPLDKTTQRVLKCKKQKRRIKKMSWEGSVIQYARISAGLTQKELSEELEIPKRTIEDWESGKRTPPIYVAKLISNYLKTI